MRVGGVRRACPKVVAHHAAAPQQFLAAPHDNGCLHAQLGFSQGRSHSQRSTAVSLQQQQQWQLVEHRGACQERAQYASAPPSMPALFTPNQRLSGALPLFMVPTPYLPPRTSHPALPTMNTLPDGRDLP